jgi:hypothetical protein
MGQAEWWRWRSERGLVGGPGSGEHGGPPGTRFGFGRVCGCGYADRATPAAAVPMDAVGHDWGIWRWIVCRVPL